MNTHNIHSRSRSIKIERKRVRKKGIKLTLFTTIFVVLSLASLVLAETGTNSVETPLPKEMQHGLVTESQRKMPVFEEKFYGQEFVYEKFKKTFEEDEYRINAKSNVSKEELLKVLERKGESILSKNVDSYLSACTEFGVDCGFLVAIGVHETGYGTSGLATKYNNISGMRCTNNKDFIDVFGISGCVQTNHGPFSVYDTVENSIRHKAYWLKVNYIDKGLVTIDQVWAKYAPLDDPNDVNGLNKNWGPSIKQKLKKMGVLK